MFEQDFGPCQFAHETAGKGLVRAVEDHWRVREKGEQPSRYDARLEGRRLLAA